tara:strand:- start:414 stop:686 length:273 start_codon:yes stop_codon:yes gene_type:complete
MREKRISIIKKCETTRLLDTLESQLKHHDWFYEYSDDSRYYNSGLREFTQIWQTIEQLQELGENEFDQAIALYKQYKPIVSTPHEQVVTK